MDEHADLSNDRSAPEHSPDSDDRHIDLDGVVVRYENRPDRCTIVPRGGTHDEQVTRWLSADLASFVDLDDAR